MNFKNHWALGTVWPITGSKGDKYEVEMRPFGFACSCPARVKCKHIKSVEYRFTDEFFEKAMIGGSYVGK